MTNKYLVSVRLMTYNHEEFIREAIESILAQRTNFLVEVVCGDDFSSDGTVDILKCYRNTENIHIRILDRVIGDSYWKVRQKRGRLYNFTNIIENCQGKYIALLDGDDYWCDPYKLQKQVDYLEANTDCVACHHWHKVAKLGKDGEYLISDAPTVGQGYYPVPKADVSRIFSNELRLKSRTVMFKNIIEKFPSWFYDVAYGDVPLSMILGKDGKFGFIDEPMAIYRLTGKGVSTAGIEDPLYTYRHYVAWIRVWEYGRNFFGFKYHKQAFRTILYFYSLILQRYNYSFAIFGRTIRYALFHSRLSFFIRLHVITLLGTELLSRRVGKFIRKYKVLWARSS